jgi:hypothetical protein
MGRVVKEKLIRSTNCKRMRATRRCGGGGEWGGGSGKRSLTAIRNQVLLKCPHLVRKRVEKRPGKSYEKEMEPNLLWVAEYY